jgi:alpha-L-rhamnosidase
LSELRVENQINPMGVEHPRPRFSWRVPNDGQRSHRLTVTTADADTWWDSGVVQSAQCVGAEYDGRPLEPRRRYLWRVQIVDSNGQVHDSDQAWFETGIGEWQAQWIGGRAPNVEPRLEGCARIGGGAAFRHTFTVPLGARILDSRVRGSGFASLNGARDGQVRTGRNVLAVESTEPIVVRLQVTFADREPLLVETDDSWLCAATPTGDWTALEYDDSGWTRGERVGHYGDPPWGRDPATERPAALLRTEFQLSKPIQQARLCASALGVYELRLNGQRVSDDVLAPGWTDYPSRVPYQVYDVTAMLRQGSNALGALLGDGWYAGYLGFFGPAR